MTVILGSLANEPKMTVMKNLTAIFCLTVALLLGSAGVSWGAGFQKDLPRTGVVTSQPL